MGGRSCLVVGGGRVAARKVGRLLDAGARVTVVSPEAEAAILRLAAEGRLDYRKRRFCEADARGRFVVIMATDDGAVNRRVLAGCRRLGVLCASADAHWTAGDFILPATARGDGLTVSVSTGGRSCGRARQVKELLARRLDLLGEGEWMTVSACWRGAPQPRAARACAERLRQAWSVHEFVIAAGPRGFEVLARVCAGVRAERLVTLLLPSGLRRPPTIRRGERAVRHAAGLLAGAGGFGAGRLARAATLARRRGWAGDGIRAWIEAARGVGRPTRSGRTTPREQAEQCGNDHERIIRGDTGGDAVEQARAAADAVCPGAACATRSRVAVRGGAGFVAGRP